MKIVTMTSFWVFITAINVSWADNTFNIVTDPWPPYAFIEQGKAVGVDVDTALAVLDTMGIVGTVTMLPWKRSLAMVKNLTADAILSAAITAKRKQFLYFPNAPLSKGDTVFFQRKTDDIVASSLAELERFKVGAMLGYQYCKELNQSALLLKASRVATLEQNFNMLMTDRIDLVVEVEAVGMFKAKTMGIANKVTVVSGSHYCASENYLAFAKKPGHDRLARVFSAELIKFKKTDEYQKILARYRVHID